MNLLYIMQQSIYNNEGKWLSADSNINMGIGIFRELLKKTDWNIYVLIGQLSDFADIKTYDELLKHERLHFIEYPFPVDAFLNRQHFDVKAWDKMIKSIPQPDVIWNNITELSRNIKTYLYYKKIPAKIISSCYWLDTPNIKDQNKVPEEISYQWRQYDGFECSDLVTFTCESTYKAWMENSEKIFSVKNNCKIIEKSAIFDFGYSTEELSPVSDSSYIHFENNKKTILFLNRMSPTNYTRHLEFIDAVNKLYKKRQDFRVVFTNPSQKVSWDWLKENVNPLHIITENSLNRQQYVELLWNADISVHLYTKELYGGCAHREAVHCNNIPVTPKVYEYARIQGDNYPFYVKNDLSNLSEVLDKTLDSEKYDNAKMIRRNLESSFEHISDHVINSILNIL